MIHGKDQNLQDGWNKCNKAATTNRHDSRFARLYDAEGEVQGCSE